MESINCPVEPQLAIEERVAAELERSQRIPIPTPRAWDELDESLPFDWSPSAFPAYARMCAELGMPFYPDNTMRLRAWWRQAAAGGIQ